MAEEKMLKEKILAYALENAIKHEGRAKVENVLSKLFQEGLTRDKIPEVIKEIKDAVNSANSLPLEEQKRQFLALENLVKKHKAREGLPPLPEAEKGKVTMRFAPFPSGPLHLGNARAALLNDEYSKMYKGKLILIMDDTIGSEEKGIVKEAYKLIEEGLKWLDVKYTKIVYRSSRLKIYYRYASELVEKNAAYVCLCPADKLRKNRAEGRECLCRQKSQKENLANWKKMLDGKFKEGEATLRIKTSMQDKNPAFRDRVLFRISSKQHPLEGKKYKVWPLMDFSAAIDDYLLGITHIIRGKELLIETEMERFIWKIFNWPDKIIIHSGLLQIEGIKISKSKSQKEIAEGEYSGWDDPRTWSLQSLKGRGIHPEAIRKFLLGLGINSNEITVPIDMLYDENRKLIDKEANRYFFTSKPKKIKILNAPELQASVPLHPSYDKGKRIFNAKSEFYISDEDFNTLKKEKFIRLMHLLNFSAKGSKFVFHSQPLDEKLKAKPIHWLPADNENEKKLINTEILMPDGIIVKGLSEEGIKKIKVGETIQFERFGFCRLNSIEKKAYRFWYAHR